MVRVTRYDGTGNNKDEATAITADANNNVYITGYTTNAAGNEDYTTISYTSTGQARWLQSYDGPAQLQDYATAITVDANNNVYVTGASTADICTKLDYTTIKYFPDGILEWVQRYNGNADKNDVATDVTVDVNGNVFVTGSSNSINYDITTVKYWQPSKFGSFVGVTYKYSGVRYNPVYEMLEFDNQTAFDTVMSLLQRNDNNFNGDKGNTEGLFAFINQTPALPESFLKDQLIAASPLSDTILISLLNMADQVTIAGAAMTSIVAINKTPVLSPNTIKEIFLANTSFSDNVINHLNTSSLPKNIRQQIIDAGDNDVIIENAVLDGFEKSFGFYSQRKVLEKQEEIVLRSGGDPEQNDPDNFFIQDTYLRTVLNPRLEVKIAQSVFKILDSIKTIEITDADLPTLNRIRQNDLTVLGNPNIVVEFMKTMPYACDADFKMTSVGISTISFTDMSFGFPTNYSWDFGDGTTSTLKNPSHTYPNIQKSYNVCLTIYDNTGGSWSKKCKTINIKSCTADFNFFISNTTQANFQNFSTGNQTSYLWDFGDGTTSTQFAPSHAYANVTKTYTVCLTISNSTGCFDRQCKTITINLAPTTNCCDKNDRDKSNWYFYAPDRKFKYTIYQTNLLFAHSWGAKTKNHRKNKRGNWKNQKADKISAGVAGTVYEKNNNGDKCSVPRTTDLSEYHLNRDSETYHYSAGNVFWTKHHSITSKHYLYYNGIRYSKDAVLFLSTDCP